MVSSAECFYSNCLVECIGRTKCFVLTLCGAMANMIMTLELIATFHLLEHCGLKVTFGAEILGLTRNGKLMQFQRIWRD